MEENYWAWAAKNLRETTAPNQETRERWNASAKQFDQYAEEGRNAVGDRP